MNNKKIVIPVEIKRRELTGKLLLSLKLVQEGHTVFLSSTDIETALDKIKPDIYFELSAVNRSQRRSRLRNLKKCGATTVVLDTEGSAFGDDSDFKPRVSDMIFEYIDYYLAWGRKSANIAKEQNTLSDVKIEIVGNPRFDLLQRPYRMVYSSDATEINEEHGRFILINTNFSVNHIDSGRNERLAPGDMVEKYKKQARLLGEFISAVGSLAENIPDHDIVVRPHPSEDVNTYRQILYVYDNVHITNSGEVRPWIQASSAVVHNSCTTGITASLLETPVFAYVPHQLTLSSIPNKVSNTCRSIPELIEQVTSAVKKNQTYRLNSKQASSLKNYIDNIDYCSSDRIVSIIQSMECPQAQTYDTRFSPGIKDQIKRLIVNTIGSERFGPVYYDRLLVGGGASYKFSKTTVEEIKSLINNYPNPSVPSGIQIDTIPGVVYGFKIYTNT
jgi:surface carbohydrate biosynthesis protein